MSFLSAATRLGPIVAATLLAAIGRGEAQIGPTVPLGADAVPGQVVVKFKEGAWAPGQTVNLAEFLGPQGRLVQSMPSVGGILIDVPASRGPAATQAAIDQLLSNPKVQYAEPNYVYRIAQTPNDPLLKDQWYLATVSAPEGWKIRSESPGLVVAVIDTGIHLRHEDLADQIWTNPNEIAANGQDDDGNGYVDDVHGWNFLGRNNDPAAGYFARGQTEEGSTCPPNEKDGRFEVHGSHVAGTIGAVGDNGKGIVGLARKVQIMPLKALGGPCGSGTLSAIIDAVAYAVKNGARVINFSLGAPSYSQILRDQLEEASRRNVLIVVAAGNSTQDNDARPSYPASYDVATVIAVAATNKDDHLDSYSNYGVKSVHLAAPGGRILSTVPKGTGVSDMGSGYDFLSGTSMATPVVSGAAALLLAQFPELPAAEIKGLLLSSVDRLEALGGKVATGGRLNVHKALTARPAAPVAVKPPPAAVKPPPVAVKPPPADAKKPPVDATRPPTPVDFGGIKVDTGPAAPARPGSRPSGELTGGELK